MRFGLPHVRLSRSSVEWWKGTWRRYGASNPGACWATKGRMNGSISGMAKEKISVTVDAAVLAAADADAKAVGLNRSEMIEQALRNEHLRVALQNYRTRTVPALDINAYAQKVYQANRAAGL